MEQHWANIIEAIGEDLTRPGLADTPKRAAKAFEFLTRGYRQSVDEVVNNALFPSESSEMVLVQDVELYSMCEHHLLPFIGKCHVAYIQRGKCWGYPRWGVLSTCLPAACRFRNRSPPKSPRPSWMLPMQKA